MKKILFVILCIICPWPFLFTAQRKVAANEAAEQKAAADLQKMKEAKELEALLPEYKWRVTVNTGAGTRNMNVDAPTRKTAEQRGLAQYMRKYFNASAYQLSFTPNPPKPVVAKQQPATPATPETK